MGRPVRRVLSGGVSPVNGHLSRRRVAAPLQRPTRGLGGPRHHPLSGLAPGEVCRADRVTTIPVVSYTALSPLPACAGGLLSVALSRGSLRVGVTHRPALWSPDVPRCGLPPRDRPADPFAPSILPAARLSPLCAPPSLRPCRHPGRPVDRAGSRSGTRRTAASLRGRRRRGPPLPPHPRVPLGCGR